MWDLDRSRESASWKEGLEALDPKIAEALAKDAPLTADEQKAKQTIQSREVTIR